MKGDKPVYRIEFAESGTKKRYRVGTIWPGNVDWSKSVKFESKDDFESKYPTMTPQTAQRLSDERKGFINMVRPKEQQQTRGGSQRDRQEGDSFDGEDIPF